MRTSSLLVCFLMLLLLADGSHAKAAGREFATAFLQNYIAYYGTPIFRLQITSLQSGCRLTVSVPSIGLVQDVQLTENQGITVTLPAVVELYGSQRSSNTIIIQSTEDICVSSLNSKPYTADTSVVYPTTEWGNEYFVFTPSVSPPTTQKEIMFINGKLPNTVEVFLQADVLFEGSMYPAGSKITVVLQPYESVQLQSEKTMSGTRIVSLLPIAVYSGHTCTWFFSKCNHVYEQLLPVTSWGTRFLVPPLAIQNLYDSVFVQASQLTNITVHTSTLTRTDTIDVAQTIEYKLKFPEPLSITADKGIQVMFLFNGVQITWSQMFDPFLLNVLPFEQFCFSYSLDGQEGFDNHALIVVPSADRDGVLLDGSPLPKTTQWRVVNNTIYSWAEFVFQQGEGVHSVDHPTTAFGLYSIGLAPMNGYGAAALCKNQDPLGRSEIPCSSDQGFFDPRCGQPMTKPGFCWATGDPHYQTFDGGHFDFMGTCTYIISKTCNSNGSVPDFEVQARNENRGSIHVSFVSLITLNVGGSTITVDRSQRGRVRIDQSLWSLPVQDSQTGVNVSQSGLYVTIQTSFGLVVQYDWESYLLVMLPATFMNKVCGLCGNFNNVTNDDFTNPTGTLGSSVEEFGRSWKVSNITEDAQCMDGCKGVCQNCAEEALKEWEGKKDCGILNCTSGPFSQCIAVVNPSIYMQNCLFDTCMFGGQRSYLCKALKVYADVCQKAGVQLTDWRNISKCPYSCPKNSYYEPCGNPCPATCLDPIASTNCSMPCVETCTCDPGFVLSGSECVPSSNCGCLQNGRHIPVGEFYWADNICHVQCRCPSHGGHLECKDVGCQTGQQCQVVNGIRGCYPVFQGTCLVSGDPHYYTFDGTRFNFQGTCIYQLVGLCSNNSALVPFEVLVQNEFRGSKTVSFTKLVQVNIYNISIVISREYIGSVMVSGVLLNLPQQLKNSQVSVFKSGWSAVIQTSFGLTVSFDWNSVATVSLSSTYAGAVCGLCGNFNGNPMDDMNPKGSVSSAPPDVVGVSWSRELVSGCVHACNDSCFSCNITLKPSYESDDFCGIISDPIGPFSECHTLLKPDGFFEDCVYDVCMFNGRKDILCQAIGAYVAACQAKGATVHSWRTDQFCGVQCPAHSHYEVCGPGCPATCNSPSSPLSCQQHCTEGCICDPGFILSGGNCVPFAQCGCFYGTKYYMQDQVFYPDHSCKKECRCMPDGQVVCNDFLCGPFEECALVNGIRQCQPLATAFCDAWGDPHYTTFDGPHFDFQGSCRYILSQTCGMNSSNLTPFVVEVENKRLPNTVISVTKQVSLVVYGHTFVLTQSMAQILVNGVLTNVPLSLDDGKVQLSKDGTNYIIKTDFGLWLTYDMSYHMTLAIPSTYHNKTCGLCGNYDGNPSNDFRLPNGSLASNVNVFGNAWKVDVPGLQCEDGCQGSQCPVCTPALKTLFEESSYCGLIADPDGPFVACHATFDPMPYLGDCVYDMCITRGSGTLACQTVAAYASKCSDAGIAVKSWRTNSFCPMSCPVNSHYDQCVDMCTVACPGLAEIVSCSTSCTEGCSCDPGFLFNGQQCVMYEQCGCYEAGRTYKPGQVILHGQCEQKCVCDPVKGLTCEIHTCSNGTQCLIRDGVLGCFYPDPCENYCCEKESCRVEEGRAMCVPLYSATCWAWGDPHYHTFDGLAYDFQGTCSYTLAKTCNSSDLRRLVPFAVTESNDRRGQVAVSLVRQVEVQVYGITVTMQKYQWGRVMVGGETLYLPLVLLGGQVTVSQVGNAAVLVTNFGLSVSYDWDAAVYLQLPSSYYASVCGLCGNFNGQHDDDVPGPSLAQWAQTWQVNRSGDEEGCSHGCNAADCPVCPSDLQNLYATQKYCGALTSSSDPDIFRECRVKMDATVLLQSCIYDLCMSRGDRRLVCRALEVYSSRCRQGGVVISGWREKFNCPMPCQPNSHYEPCSSPCPLTCSSPELQHPPNCTGICVEDCACDRGYVLSGTSCVPAYQCGCTYEGRYYTPGQNFWADEGCTRLCQCNGTLGVVTCRGSSCPAGESCQLSDGRRDCLAQSAITAAATCQAYGDPHYRTFDGRPYDFQGTCIYQLVALCLERDGLEAFNVTVHNEHRGNTAVSFTKTVAISAFGVRISLTVDAQFQILLDGLLISLPFEMPDKLKVYLGANAVILETTFGLHLTFTRPGTVRVTLASSYSHAVCGLCGNYNGNAEDDFAAPDGIQEPNAALLGRSWQVGTVTGCTSEPCQGSQCPSCTYAQRQNAQRYCSIISDPGGPFGECHTTLDPAPFLANCVFDTCMHEGVWSVLCDGVASYATACQSNGLMVQPWRNDTFCRLSCPPNSHYNICTPNCPQTCASFSQQCSTPCGEGCQCDSGFILSGQTCKPISECGCFYGGRYYEKWQEFYLREGCQARCRCVENGAVACQLSGCGPGESCSLQGGQLGCYPTGYSVCIASGDPHYVSFDGRRFDFQGTCIYTLVKVCRHGDERLTNFSVATENQRFGGGRVSVVRAVTMTVYNFSIRIGRGQGVMVNNANVNLPVVLDQGRVKVSQTGLGVTLQTDFNLQVFYSSYHVEVRVPSNYNGSVCGLCGNFNNNPSDDFQLPNGNQSANVNVFGQAWALVPVGVPCGGCVGDCSTCETTKADQYKRDNFCGLISLTSGPFIACHEHINPKPYVENCVFDLCVLDGSLEMLCQSIEAYAVACQRAGWQIQAWRNSSFCAVQCPANSHYSLCSHNCANTCASLHWLGGTCPEKCQEGCVCDEGYMWDGDECVLQKDCGCVHQGKYLKLGEVSVSEECDVSCLCHAEGQLQCVKQNCSRVEVCEVRAGRRGCQPESGSCVVGPGASIRSFDGATGALEQQQQLSGAIQMAFLCDEESPDWFRVVLDARNCAHDAAVEVYIFMLDAVVTVNRQMHSWVNGRKVPYPSSAASERVQLVYTGESVIIERAPLFTLKYTHTHQVTLVVSNILMGKMCGVCGNYNQSLTVGKNSTLLMSEAAWQAEDFSRCGL